MRVLLQLKSGVKLHDIDLSDGTTRHNCWLVVSKAVSGTSKAKGFRLYWTNDGVRIFPTTPDSSFDRERDAIRYGIRKGWGKALRCRA